MSHAESHKHCAFLKGIELEDRLNKGITQLGKGLAEG